jgi:hypothetical protein
VAGTLELSGARIIPAPDILPLGARLLSGVAGNTGLLDGDSRPRCKAKPELGALAPKTILSRSYTDRTIGVNSRSVFCVILCRVTERNNRTPGVIFVSLVMLERSSACDT